MASTRFTISMPFTFREAVPRAFIWLYERSVYLAGIAGLYLTLADILDWNEITCAIGQYPQFPIGYWLTGVFATTFLVSSIFAVERERTLKRMEIKLSEIENDAVTTKKELGLKINESELIISRLERNVNDLLEAYLRIASRHLKCTFEERISIYRVQEGKMILLGRICDNPELSNARRSSYPISQGFIGKAWKEGLLFVQNLPDPDKDLRAYHAECNKIAPIEMGVIKQVRMKSRSYHATRICGYDKKPRALVVVESMRPSGIDQLHVNNFIDQNSEQLISFVERVRFVEGVDGGLVS